MLEASELTLWRGHTCLFDQLSFRLAPGRALIVRGPNGSGKTTLLRVLCGLTRAESGTVAWNGEVQQHALRGRAAYSGHQSALNADLTVRQNLDFYAALQGVGRGAWEALLGPLALAQCADLEVRHLSAGQKRRAALVRVLIAAAPAWILDEPMTNLDAEGRGFVEERVARHLAAGGLAVIAAHDETQLPPDTTEPLWLGGHA
jgi:heme exporter protein A